MLWGASGAPGYARELRTPEKYEALPYAEVLIDAGHGGIDSGAYYEDVLEKDINLAIAKKVYALLKAYRFSVVLNRTGDYALSDDNRWHVTRSRHRKDLSQRGQLTEEIRTGMLISLHVNWTSDRSKHGPLVLHQRSGESALLALCLQDALNRQQHSRFLPREGKPFYLLNRVKQPAVIIEMGFVSNAEDRAMLTSAKGQDRIAHAIVSGLRHYRTLAR
ncbi:N-acetylmuramoyl-L-alanine amidase [Paenibacillus beijingensis]|uniref:N-acetylmuramoyl-L-alanine amidase n=2 Tax=Paenibacillus beijingensis TaxID=1126833 RepID=A0A0D5NS96_9BACL|nr:N-acetylmuramoyl-L-alanine amidase [Paenibacillus beijingensis]